MGISGGPDIVQDGLVLELDAADKNSYPGSGTTWRDLSGNANNGTLTNGPTFNTGSAGSIVFDGVDDYVNIGNIGNFGSNPITYEWVLKSTPNGNFQSILINGTDNQAHIYLMDNGNIRYFSTTSYDTVGLNVNTNIFKILSITKSGSTALIYVNGILAYTLGVASQTGNFNQLTLAANLTAPPGVVSYPLKGNIANFKLYNRALSSTEILQNYNATKTRFGL